MKYWGPSELPWVGGQVPEQAESPPPASLRVARLASTVLTSGSDVDTGKTFTSQTGKNKRHIRAVETLLQQ